ncbi:MAG: hypothetical protein HOJ58_03055, partial [Chloroflexi bacterium]|nr:hypothetical protein [Chloroflexota bacterium]
MNNVSFLAFSVSFDLIRNIVLGSGLGGQVSPNGKIGDKVDKMWGKAIGEQKIFHIQDEQRAVDYA